MKKEKKVLDLNEKLSEHFTLREFVVSGVALKHHIDNTPKDEKVVSRLRALCEKTLEPLRRRFGRIRITSGYRCEPLNKAVGGRLKSQHLYGEAADIHIASKEEGLKMFDYIRQNLPFDQLLFEHQMINGCCWLHVSLKSDRGENRYQAIRNYEA